MRFVDRRRSHPSILDDERFMRGIALGALIGAAIAGSTLWSRLRRSGRGSNANAVSGSDEAGRP